MGGNQGTEVKELQAASPQFIKWPLIRTGLVQMCTGRAQSVVHTRIMKEREGGREAGSTPETFKLVEKNVCVGGHHF